MSSSCPSYQRLGVKTHENTWLLSSTCAVLSQGTLAQLMGPRTRTDSTASRIFRIFPPKLNHLSLSLSLSLSASKVESPNKLTLSCKRPRMLRKKRRYLRCKGAGQQQGAPNLRALRALRVSIAGGRVHQHHLLLGKDSHVASQTAQREVLETSSSLRLKAITTFRSSNLQRNKMKQDETSMCKDHKALTAGRERQTWQKPSRVSTRLRLYQAPRG